MAKKYSKENLQKLKETTDNSYELHHDAVDRLVDANQGNVPEVPDEVIDSYRKSSFLSKIPTWVKALFIKFWFNGAVCFFFIWGLSNYITNNLDLVIVTGIAMGIVTDMLVNPVLRFLHDDINNYERWIFISPKKFWAYLLNIVYCLVLMFIVVFMTNGVNNVINAITNAEVGTTYFRVEPFSFGAMFLAVDLMFIGIKIYIKKLIDDANRKLSNKE